MAEDFAGHQSSGSTETVVFAKAIPQALLEASSPPVHTPQHPKTPAAFAGKGEPKVIAPPIGKGGPRLIRPIINKEPKALASLQSKGGSPAGPRVVQPRIDIGASIADVTLAKAAPRTPSVLSKSATNVFANLTDAERAALGAAIRGVAAAFPGHCDLQSKAKSSTLATLTSGGSQPAIATAVPAKAKAWSLSRQDLAEAAGSCSNGAASDALPMTVEEQVQLAKKPRLCTLNNHERSVADAVHSGQAPLIMECEEEKWEEQWADVFKVMFLGRLETRAAEYAETVVSLKKNSESLRQKQGSMQASCGHLLQTAYREALQVRLKSLMDAATQGVTPEVIEAAMSEVNARSPPVPPNAMSKAAPPPSLSSLSSTVMSRAGLHSSSLQQLAAHQLLAAAPSHSPILGGNPTLPPAAFAANSADPQSATNLYVSGLPVGTDELSFRALFGNYGDIMSANVLADKGYGFVKYRTKLEALAAIEALNGLDMNGGKLQVRYAKFQPQPQEPGGTPVAPVVVAPAAAPGSRGGRTLLWGTPGT